MRIGILGAGLIGGFIGGRLAAGGAEVTMVGRPAMGAALDAGLHLTDLDGPDRHLPPGRIRFGTDPGLLADCKLVLICVKSAQTAGAAAALAPVLPPGTRVMTMQNGIGHAEVLAAALPQARVLRGIVPFNVVSPAPGHLRRTTSGTLLADRDAGPFAPAFAAAGLPLDLRPDMEAVMWGKLLMNLNNAVNTLSGLPLREELAQRDYRRCLALAQDEALAVLAAARLRPARLTPLPLRLMPAVLRLPDPAFRLIAGRMLRIDPAARSSMAEDLAAGRPSEIDWLNGAVVALAARLGARAPVNARLTALVHAAFASPRRWPAAELLADLHAHALSL
ncbi:2-dehydropantoate 2-reductase [Gemmobacter sp.]|uniref:2-dehydropantoate 2-reductase n=1 Tax=Gemmobacter sp. TaxID=1898957 RepID=UPI002AFFF14A|nr:2-dehydropantoate 2-reductase [Gemmobacter sp.]